MSVQQTVSCKFYEVDDDVCSIDFIEAFVWVKRKNKNMADGAVKAANMARVLAIVHIIVGFLLFCFGIADRVVELFWTGYGYFGIWIGIWVSRSVKCLFFRKLSKNKKAC